MSDGNSKLLLYFIFLLTFSRHIHLKQFITLIPFFLFLIFLLLLLLLYKAAYTYVLASAKFENNLFMLTEYQNEELLSIIYSNYSLTR